MTNSASAESTSSEGRLSERTLCRPQCPRVSSQSVLPETDGGCRRSETGTATRPMSRPGHCARLGTRALPDRFGSGPPLELAHLRSMCVYFRRHRSVTGLETGRWTCRSQFLHGGRPADGHEENGPDETEAPVRTGGGHCLHVGRVCIPRGQPTGENGGHRPDRPSDQTVGALFLIYV